LHWAGWVLSLPVLIFSCQPFFRGAFQDLKHFKLSMDLPVAIGMLLTFFLSCAVTFVPNDIWGMETYFDSLTMFATFLLGGRWLELRLRDKTLGALDAIMNRIPKGIERLTPNGLFEMVSTHRLLQGDVIRIQTHQSFPADGLLKSEHTWVEESLLNGESNPIDKALGSNVMAGSINLGPDVLIEVTQVGDSTRFASIVHLLEEAESSKPVIAKMADKVAKPFVATVLLCAFLSALWWWPHSPLKALLVASAVLIVTCPCALSLATPSALIACAGFLAKQGVLMRDLGTLERLSQIDVAVFDKTGTLTKNILQLRNIFTSPQINPVELFALARALAKHSPHPLSRSLEVQSNLEIMDQAQQLEIERLGQCIEVLSFKELPGVGLEGTLVFNGKTLDLRLGSFKSVSHLDTSHSLEPQTKRAQIHLSIDQQWLGAFLFDEELKAEAQLVINQLKAQNIGVYIYSGDQIERVQKIATQVNLPVERCLGLLSPSEKLQRIKVLQSQGHRVMMVGDGYNDLPVLAGADVSLVFGSATQLAQERSDCVVLHSSLSWVLVCLQQAKASLKVVRQNLFWAFSYNLICIPLALMGYLPSWLAGLGMALSSLGVVLNAYRLQLQSARPNPTLTERR
jgi:Cu2+-exporting ATPase